MATGKHRDPVTGQFVPLTYTGTGPAQTVPSAPRPRFVGDLWVDTDDAETLSWDTTWQYPPLLNGWRNYDPGWGQMRYRKALGGLVCMEGLIQGGAVGSTIFNLPPGYRPVAAIIWSAQASFPILAHMYTYANGDVRCEGVASGGNLADWLDISVAHFGQ